MAAARIWFGLLRASALFNEESGAAVAALLPVMRLAGAETAEDWRPQNLAAWWQAAKEDEGAGARAALLYSLFDALGEPVPSALWEALLDGPQRTTVAMPRPALWFRLESAAEAGRRGETVLLCLLALGEGGPGQADPVILHRVLTSLGAVGLLAEAGALAVEAAVAAGL